MQQQVRVYEENALNRSIASTDLSIRQKNVFNVRSTNTSEQCIIEKALTRGDKIVLSSNGTGDSTRPVKRLQNTPMRRWKERAKQFEKRHQITSPYRLLNKKKKK